LEKFEHPKRGNEVCLPGGLQKRKSKFVWNFQRSPKRKITQNVSVFPQAQMKGLTIFDSLAAIGLNRSLGLPPGFFIIAL